ncbi:MAG: hypothetical protein ACXQS4_01610, partial [Methermicoccaceae archaeon]
MQNDEDGSLLDDVEMRLKLAKRIGVSPDMALLLSELLDFTSSLMKRNRLLYVYAGAVSLLRNGASEQAIEWFIRQAEEDARREAEKAMEMPE